MKINKIQNNNINFNGIYKIPINKVNLEEVRYFTLPIYKLFSGEDVVMTIGSHPCSPAFDYAIDKLVERTGNSREWLKLNAEIHKVDTSNFVDPYYQIITTKSDIKKIKKYMIRRTINLAFKQLFGINEKVNPNLPNHLKGLQKILNMANEEKIKYNKYVHVTELKDMDEFILKVIPEFHNIQKILANK